MVKSLFVNMATGYTREWIRFFTGCGIPEDVATMYALIFYENRIQKNMLLDLNKEYLRDMGITVMGDVIAILRYAKKVHEKYIREQILSVDDSAALDESIVTNESCSVIKKSTPMKRMLEHYTRKYNSSELDSNSDVKIILPSDQKTTFIAKKLTDRLGISTNSPIKKKIQISTKQTDLKEKGLEVPVPKVRRVLPENEGGYKIKMPSGTTERSKKLLEQAKKRKTRTVFERLGESSVSSTTSDVSLGNSLPVSLTSINPTAHKEKNSSVFSRLGEKTSVVSSTSSLDDSEYMNPDQLPYAGILKATGLNKKNLPNTTMRADDEQHKSEVTKFNLKKGISVKKRLGLISQEKQDFKMDMSKRLEARKLMDVQKEERQTKGTVLKLSNKFNSSNMLGKKDSSLSNTASINFNNPIFESQQAKVVVSTTTQVQNADLKTLKRKLNSDAKCDVGPSKKVRFGGTSHRLIPPSNSSELATSVKTYPKLTMIINNRAKNNVNPTLSSGIRIGPLNSDKMRQKIAMKERIGKKSFQGGIKILPKKNKFETSSEKISTIHDRLG